MYTVYKINKNQYVRNSIIFFFVNIILIFIGGLLGLFGDMPESLEILVGWFINLIIDPFSFAIIVGCFISLMNVLFKKKEEEEILIDMYFVKKYLVTTLIILFLIMVGIVIFSGTFKTALLALILIFFNQILFQVTYNMILSKKVLK